MDERGRPADSAGEEHAGLPSGGLVQPGEPAAGSPHTRARKTRSARPLAAQSPEQPVVEPAVQPDAPVSVRQEQGVASESSVSGETAAVIDASPAMPQGAPGVAPAKRTFPPPAGVPTQQGERGIRYDFNDGCRVVVPAAGDGSAWQVRLRDIATGNVLFDTQIMEGVVCSTKKYFVPFAIEVRGAAGVWHHAYCARGERVLIQFPVGTLGDTVGWLPYAVRFGRQHGCRLTCAMSGLLIPLFEHAYPDIEFITHEAVRAETYYATYSLGLFFTDEANIWQPVDFRHVGLHRTAGYILGVDPAEEAPIIRLADPGRPIEERYVCIGVQSSMQCKYWNYPGGWMEVVRFLKENGYRVICIDQKPVHGAELTWNQIPYGAEDETGDRPLVERARWLRHAEFYIGLSSGLSWLAWAMQIPVVMISGFTHPDNEFATPYRVINYHTCNSCWNDPRHQFAHQDFFWCPRHKDTPRQFECSRLITPAQVKATICRIPAFRDMAATRELLRLEEN